MKYVLLSLCLFFTFLGNAQVTDFNNYKPLSASGEMPEEFRSFTFEKIETDKEAGRVADGISKRQNKEFLRGVHYGIDQILQSGRVLYGDPISKYVSNVGNLITANNPSLSKIRFYTLRSNVVNAFSTQQGIIFVTEGLLAQLTNEAQLAFVLAHEIAHYLENHVVQGYVEHIEISNSRISSDNKIKELSQYSRSKELEADRIGVELYHKAGYSKEVLFDIFDVMAYSYLPFDLEKVDKSYWNSTHLFIPESFFTDEIPEISVDKSYDDSKSSHPNISERLKELSNLVEGINRWGDVIYHFDEAAFKEAQTIARFETVRSDLFNFRYAEAIYAIMLLEREYPNSIYLNRCKAQAWAGLINGKIDGYFLNNLVKPSLVQGDPHQVNYFLKNLSKKQLVTVGLRQVIDIKNRFPTDDEIQAIYSYTLEQIARADVLDFSKFHDFTYQSVQFSIDENAEEADYFDKSKDEESLTKYDKIKQQSGGGKNHKKVAEEDFHLYALSDVINNSIFLNEYQKYRDKQQVREEKVEAFKNLSERKQRKARKKAYKKSLMLGIDNFILIDPQIIRFDKKEKVDLDKSEKLKVKLHDAIMDFEGPGDVHINNVGMSNFHKNGTNIYNQHAVLMGALMQMAEYPKSRLFPVDYALYNDIINEYGTSKVAFPFIEARRGRPVLNTLAYFFVAGPFAVVFLPSELMKMYVTEFNVLVFDIENFEVDTYTSNAFYGVSSRPTVKALLYDFVNIVRQPKD